MKVIVMSDMDAAYRKAAGIIASQVRENPASRLGLATGSTAKGIYRCLVEHCRSGNIDFSRVHTVNLDEYRGLSKEHPQSYASSMSRWLFDHVNIDKQHTFVASGTLPEAEACRAFSAHLAHMGRLDLQLLGVGVSGHIGFNESGSALHADVHIQVLHPDTLQANAVFFNSEDEMPRRAITMGVGDILKARKILLVAAANKTKPMHALLKGDWISTKIPVTLLKLHPDITVVTEAALAAEIGWESE